MRSFCDEMTWSALALMVRRYQERLDFGGGSADLEPLLSLKYVQLGRAKASGLPPALLLLLLVVVVSLS